MCLNEIYSKVDIGKNLTDEFPVQNGLKQGNSLSPLFLNIPTGRTMEIRMNWN